MTEAPAPKSLQADLAALGVRAGPEQVARLKTFATLVGKWNRRFNLLSRQDVGRLWPRHIFDSLSVASLIGPGPVLDVGTGGGFPGIPLAVVLEDREFLLCDRNARKCRFVELAARELGLDHVSVHCGDAGALPQRFGTIVSRAVATPLVLKEQLGHLLAPGGELLALAATQGGGATLPEGARTVTVRVPGLARPHEVAIIR